MSDTPSPDVPIQEVGSVPGSDALNRLSLTFHVDPSGLGSNFHELRWLIKTAHGWEAFRIISSALFQAGSTRRRWISDLHSFESGAGIAIVKVGEADAPGFDFRVSYSWMSFRLKEMHLELLKHCADPFEKYTNI